MMAILVLLVIGFDISTWETFGMWWGIATIAVELVAGYKILDRLSQGY